MDEEGVDDDDDAFSGRVCASIGSVCALKFNMARHAII